MKPALILLAFAALTAAQPRVGYVEVYGNRKVSRERIEKAVGVLPGDALPKSKGDVEEKLEGIDGLLAANLEAFCCEDGKPVLYVGVLERGQPSFETRPSFTDDIALPEAIVSVWNDFTVALDRAAAQGDTKEDLSAGHSMMNNIGCRVLQERFVGLAQLHEAELRKVLNSAIDPEQRMIAAYVIGYVPDKSTVIGDLQQALRDPDVKVRANAARSLRAISMLPARENHRLALQATWFVEMLNSIWLSDRIEGSQALLTSFDKIGEQAMAQIRERSLASLFEMAHWRHLPHALPAYLVLGKVAAIPDEEMQRSWANGQRNEMLARIEKTFRK